MADFSIKNGVLTKYFGTDENVIVPAGVTAIGSFAFFCCGSLKSITLPAGVTAIRDRAFYRCAGLNSIKLPEGVKKIDFRAFHDCFSLKSIVFPDGLKKIGEEAFFGCKSLNEITVPAGVKIIGEKAFSGCEGLTGVTISDGTTAIGYDAFSRCEGLNKITIPVGMTVIGGSKLSCFGNLTGITLLPGAQEIGDKDFYCCKRLNKITVPMGVTKIGKRAFSGCENLTDIALPASVTVIGDGAFSCCVSLTDITLPASVTVIGDGAFSGCENLKKITLSENITKIGSNTFYGCSDLTVSGDSSGKMPSLWKHCKVLYPHLTDAAVKQLFLNPEEWAKIAPSAKFEMFCFKRSGTLIDGYRSVMTEENIAQFAEAFLIKLKKMPSIEECNAAAVFCIQFSESVPVKFIKQIYTALKGIPGAESVTEVLEADEVLAPIVSADCEAEPVLPAAEKLILEFLQKDGKTYENLREDLKDFYGLTPNDLPEIQYTDGTAAAPTVLTRLLTVHEEKAGNELSEVYNKPGSCEEATEILRYIDSAGLQKALQALADQYCGIMGNSKKRFLAYPLCRYADAETMNKMLKSLLNRGSFFYVFRRACLYSNHRSAMLLAEKYGELDAYAKIRGTDAQTLRDTVLSDFGFDPNGEKQYSLGSTTVVVSLQKDLTLSLFDLGQNKVVKSVPKRGNDAALVEAARADFAELKQNVKKVAKNRRDRLFEDFLSGRKTKADEWKNIYTVNPLLRYAAELTVWDQNGVTFTLNGKTAIRSDGTAYFITDKPICVAHPIQMNPNEIAAWQKYFASNQLKQPFAQIWEPAIDPSTVKPDRYQGCTVPANFFRGAEKHGLKLEEDLYGRPSVQVTVPDCTLETEQLQQQYNYLPDNTLTLGKFTFNNYSRRINHLVTVLDRWTVFSRIKKDDVSVCALLDSFTPAQISEFVDVALENHAVNVTALLLNYKHEHFPDYAFMDEFVL